MIIYLSKEVEQNPLVSLMLKDISHAKILSCWVNYVSRMSLNLCLHLFQKTDFVITLTTNTSACFDFNKLWTVSITVGEPRCYRERSCLRGCLGGWGGDNSSGLMDGLNCNNLLLLLIFLPVYFGHSKSHVVSVWTALHQVYTGCAV